MSSNSLTRRIGLPRAILFLIGNIIGVGIFIMPSEVAGFTGSPMLYLGVWFLGGLMALAGAMSSAELGVLMPHAGGDYVFLRRNYGLPFGFLYGYLSFIMSFTGAIAVSAIAVSHFQLAELQKSAIDIAASNNWTDLHALVSTVSLKDSLFAFELDKISPALSWLPEYKYSFQWKHIIAIVLIMGMTLINHFGIKGSATIQAVITIIPILIMAIAGIVILGMSFYGAGETSEILSKNMAYASEVKDSPWNISRALIPVFFTFTGWNATLYLAEDVRNPSKVLPLSMIISLLIVSGVYFLFNFVLLSTNPFESLMQPYSSFAANVNAWTMLVGKRAADVINIIIALLILAGMNTTILAGSRLYLAMARDGIFPEQAALLHKKHNTPFIGLWAQAVVTALIIVVFPDFDSILSMTTLSMVFLSMLTISTVFILRRNKTAAIAEGREKNKKLFRKLGYPFMPALYIALALFILIGSSLGDSDDANKYQMQAMWGGIFIAIGFAFYFLFGYIKQRRLKKNPAAMNGNVHGYHPELAIDPTSNAEHVEDYLEEDQPENSNNGNYPESSPNSEDVDRKASPVK